MSFYAQIVYRPILDTVCTILGIIIFPDPYTTPCDLPRPTNLPPQNLGIATPRPLRIYASALNIHVCRPTPMDLHVCDGWDTLALFYACHDDQRSDLKEDY